jgi:twitching motility two-component system response regulator PilG
MKGLRNEAGERRSDVRRACLVVVDASPTIREVVAFSLRDAGYEVLAFPDRSQTCHWLSHSNQPLPSLILLDINLPHLDGYELAALLKQQAAFATIPIVLLTNRDGLLDRLKGSVVKAEAYLTKPFLVQQLVATVQIVLQDAAQASHA